MPFDLLALVEKDETLATCQCFNAEVCYGSGLQYCTAEASASVKSAVEDFTLDNDIAAYFRGICQDFKHFGFAVSVLILNEDGTKIVRLLRKGACYCCFTPADKRGSISKILYANWRKSISARADIEEIELLDPSAPWRDLQDKLAKGSKTRKFAIVSRIPTVDSTYYPIPYYGALFCGKWYNIKQLIGIAKEAKLRNSAPIKYHIGIYYNTTTPYVIGLYTHCNISIPISVHTYANSYYGDDYIGDGVSGNNLRSVRFTESSFHHQSFCSFLCRRYSLYSAGVIKRI